MPPKQLTRPTSPQEAIDHVIQQIRGVRVILDSDLVALYGVPTFRFNESIKRNRHRFPTDFMFQLTREEFDFLTSQIAISKPRKSPADSRGGRRTLPYAFTEYGALQAANVLRSTRAVQMSVLVIRAFVRLREMLMSNADLAQKLIAMEKKYDAQFRIVFDAIRELAEGPPDPEKPRIGFRP